MTAKRAKAGTGETKRRLKKARFVVRRDEREAWTEVLAGIEKYVAEWKEALLADLKTHPLKGRKARARSRRRRGS